MKSNRLYKKELVQPELGPRNWVAGKSLNDSASIGFPGEKFSACLQKFIHSKSKGKNDKNLFLKG